MDEVVSIVSRFVGAAVWSLAAMLGVALVVGTVAYCGERLRRFVRLGLVLCGLAVCVTLFSVKPPSGNTNGVNRVRAPLRVPRPPVPVEPAADVVRISEIAVTTNGIDLVLHRPSTNDLAAVEVVLVGSTNLVAATWEAYTNLVFGAGETNVAVWVGRAQLDAHAVSTSCFFAFINAGDSDEDGLADWHERFNLKTNPDAADSDGDGLRDDWEIAHGRDPRSSVDCVLSTRADGVPDVYVIRHGGDPDSPSDGALVPVFTASENSGTDLAAALAASVPYSIVEVESGVHEGAGWTGIRFPPHPVYVRPASGGPNRTVLRHRDRVGIAGGGLAAFEIPSGTPPGTCVEGLRVELLGESDPQIAFWVGSNIPGISGTGCGAVFRDVVVRMPRPGVQNWAWYLGSPTDDAVALSGCAVDARGATAACGVWAVSSGPILVENCSFLNFPFGGDTRFEYGVGIGLDATARQMPANAAVRVTGTLFDASFTNGWMLARVGEATNRGVYSVSFDHSLLPSHFPSVAARRPDAMEGLLFGESGVAVTGQLTNEQSFAVGACPRPRFSHIDLNGLGRAAPTDIGAFSYAPVPAGALDTDGDGISDADEFARGTDPFSDDTDGDGVPDPVEIAQGTDPAAPLSFLRHIAVAVTNNAAIANTTNYVARGTTPDWTADDLGDVWTATGRGGTGAFDGVSASQRVFVKAYRDLDKDGICDPLREPVVARSVGQWDASPTFRFIFGDVDGDGVDDADEFSDGTNPNDVQNFLFAATLVVTNVDATASITNHLAWWSVEGEIVGEAAFTGARFEQTVSTVVTNGRLNVSCWRDLDRDGVYTLGEDDRRSWTFMRNGRISISVGDMDGDGVGDGVELAEGTDPRDRLHFRLRSQMELIDLGGDESITNHWAVAATSNVWTFVAERASSDMFTTVHVDEETTNGTVWVVCRRDLDRNGIQEGDLDVLYVKRLGGSSDGNVEILEVGDRDGDGVPDGEERLNGTDPLNGKHFCCNLSVVVKGVFSTDRSLTCLARWGSDVVVGPVVATNSVMVFDYGHVVATNGEVATVCFWEDRDDDGAIGLDEKAVRMTFCPQGHETVVTNVLTLGVFDEDKDGLPDCWETAHGISNALADADGDGFINLHEYWAGTSPTNALENGEGTVLSAMAHAVDDRIAGTTVAVAAPYYVDYDGAHDRITSPSNAVLQANENCWMADIDLSCLAVWNSVLDGAWPRQMTAISPWHVLTATHMEPSTNMVVTFRSHSGDIVVRRIVATRQILEAAGGDDTVGILDAALPDSIHPAEFLPPGYESYIGNGRKLPLVRIGRDKSCNIHDVVYLAPSISHLDTMSRVEYSSKSMRNQYRRGPIAFDSGHPNFFLLNGEIVYLCPTRGFYSDNQATGYLCTSFLDRIQGTMDKLSRQKGCPMQRMTLFDFSVYPSLPYIGEANE